MDGVKLLNDLPPHSPSTPSTLPHTVTQHKVGMDSLDLSAVAFNYFPQSSTSCYLLKNLTPIDA